MKTFNGCLIEGIQIYLALRIPLAPILMLFHSKSSTVHGFDQVGRIRKVRRIFSSCFLAPFLKPFLLDFRINRVGGPFPLQRHHHLGHGLMQNSEGESDVVEYQAEWPVRMTLGSFRMGSSEGIGSLAVTSSPAPAIRPRSKASTREACWMIPPLPCLSGNKWVSSS